MRRGIIVLLSYATVLWATASSSWPTTYALAQQPNADLEITRFDERDRGHRTPTDPQPALGQTVLSPIAV